MTKYKSETKVLDVLEALASPVRLQIIALLKGSPVGAMGLNMIVDGIAATRKLSKSHICEQLQILEKAGLVKKGRMSQFVWYSLQGDRLQDADRAVEGLMQKVDPKRRGRNA